MAVWLTFWTASMLVVTWMVGVAAWRGDYGAAPFLLLWLGFAAFGVHGGVRRLQALLGLARPLGGSAPTARRRWTGDPPNLRDG